MFLALATLTPIIIIAAILGICEYVYRIRTPHHIVSTWQPVATLNIEVEPRA